MSPIIFVLLGILLIRITEMFFCFMANHKTGRIFCIFDKKVNALIIDIGSDFYIEQLLEFDFAMFL